MCVCFRGVLGFLNRDDICMCVVNKQFDFFTFTAGSVFLCCVGSHVVIFGMSVSLTWYPMWMR